MPMVSARPGTGPAPKEPADAARVSAARATTRVIESNDDPGSLNAMWPLPPMPSTQRSRPPAAAMSRS